MTKGKKKKFVLLGLLLAGFVLYRYGSPRNRFIRDGRDPSTAWGAQLVGKDIAAQLAWHLNPANGSGQYAEYVSKGWSLKQG